MLQLIHYAILYMEYTNSSHLDLLSVLQLPVTTVFASLQYNLVFTVYFTTLMKDSAYNYAIYAN